MNNKIFRLLGAVLFLISALGYTVADTGKPQWVKQRPISKTHYIGIGYAKKSDENVNYQQIAKDNALNDLASQIRVKISSEIVRQVVERSGAIDEDFKSMVRSSTKAELEDYELVDTWEDSKEYWVYYRLSKVVYETKKREKINKAVSLSLNLFASARQYEKSGDIEKALSFYFQALKPVEKYAAEPLETTFEGDNIYLINELFTSLQHLISKIELSPVENRRAGKIGKPLKSPLEVLVSYETDNGAPVKVSNLPVQFSFIRGSGDLIKNTFSNREGKAYSQVSKITATDRIQIVSAKVNLNKYVPEDSPSILQRGFVTSFVLPATKFTLQVTGLSAFVETSETHFGERLKVLHIEPALKKALSDQGFIFVENAAEADIMFNILAESRRGAEMFEMFSAFVNLTISVTDMNTGDEIYKDTLPDIKGIDLTYSKAGLKAFDNAAKKITNKIIPDLIRKIQR